MTKKTQRNIKTHYIYSAVIMSALLFVSVITYHQLTPKQANHYDAVKPLHHIHQIQIIFAQADARLAFYYYEGDFSDNARIDMTDRYDMLNDYLDLLKSDDTEILSLSSELQPFITQWRLVLDKIFNETADYQSILPLANRINQLLEALANRQDELLKIRFDRPNDFER